MFWWLMLTNSEGVSAGGVEGHREAGVRLREDFKAQVTNRTWQQDSTMKHYVTGKTKFAAHFAWTTFPCTCSCTMLSSSYLDGRSETWHSSSAGRWSHTDGAAAPVQPGRGRGGWRGHCPSVSLSVRAPARQLQGKYNCASHHLEEAGKKHWSLNIFTESHNWLLNCTVYFLNI